MQWRLLSESDLTLKKAFDIVQSMNSRFLDVFFLEELIIFDPSVIEQQSEFAALEKLEILTNHYGPDDVIKNTEIV